MTDAYGIALCTKYCLDCAHASLSGATRAGKNASGGGSMHCDYILNTSHRRPCPAGDGCTEKVPFKRSKGSKSRGKKVKIVIP